MSLVLWTISCLVASCFSLTVGLRFIRFEVPQEVYVGDDVKLTCDFDLEDDTLYSIKWYSDDREFYRYVPSDRPPHQYFHLYGVNLDKELAENGTYILKDVDKESEGIYMCELSSDLPTFITISRKSVLTVKDMPHSGSMRLPYHSLLATSLMLIVLWIM